MKQQAQGLVRSAPSSLHIYYNVQLSILVGLLRVWANGSLSLILLFLSWLVLSSLDDTVFVLSHYIFFCHVWLFSFSSLFFPLRERERERVWIQWERKEGGSKRTRGGKLNQGCMRKESVSIKWKKKPIDTIYEGKHICKVKCT